MEKSEEIKQSWTGQKTWLSVSEQFLAAMTKDFFLEGKLGIKLCLHLVFRFS